MSIRSYFDNTKVKESNGLPEPSEEQAEIITSVLAGNNIIVDSVAGSGKTTTSLLLASKLSDKRFILITYNSRLKQETRDRVTKAGLANIEVHSYHSFGLKYYVEPCFTDLDLKKIIQNEMSPRRKIGADIFIFDEAQDLTPIYYKFLLKVIADNSRSGSGGSGVSGGSGGSQVILLGDHLQCIYDFPQKGADYRFLTLADQLFSTRTTEAVDLSTRTTEAVDLSTRTTEAVDLSAQTHKRPWTKHYLRVSYRLTKPMASFVNDVMLGYNRLTAIKESKEPVRYVTGNPFNVVPQYFYNEICSLLNRYEPDDIFILAPSVKSNNDMNPVKKLENILVKNGISCFCPTNDDEDLKDEVIKGKVLFSSFHQSKGLERKVVIVTAFSSSYYFVGKDEPRDVCPKPIYVAATRAKEILYLWGEDGGDQMPLLFLKSYTMALPRNIANFRFIELTPARKRGIEKNEFKSNYILRRVTQLIKFVPEEVVQSALDLLKIRTICEPKYDYDIPLIISTKDGKMESVSDLNGTAIPAMYEQQLTGSSSIQEDLDKFYLQKLQSGISISDMRVQWISAIKSKPILPADFLLLANLYNSYISGYLFKLAQITEYDWLTEKMALDLMANMQESVKVDSEFLEFEYTLSFEEYEWGTSFIQLDGRADLIDDNVLWELKCVNSIQSEHILQLALYAWLWENTERAEHGKRAFRILNIRTGEIQEITGIENLDHVLGMILENHFRVANKKTDQEFMDSLPSGENDVVMEKTNTKIISTGFMFQDD